MGAGVRARRPACALAGSGDGARRWLLFALVAVWGLRLGTYLAVRKLGDRAEDRRYAVMRERKGTRSWRWSLVSIFGLRCCWC